MQRGGGDGGTWSWGHQTLTATAFRRRSGCRRSNVWRRNAPTVLLRYPTRTPFSHTSAR